MIELGVDLGWSGDALEPCEAFDFEQVYRDLDGDPAEQADNGAETLRSLLQAVWEQPGDLAAARSRFRAMASEAMRRTPANRGAAGFARLVQWCYGCHRSPGIAWRWFVAVSATIDPRLVAGKDYATLAKELGVCKASTSGTARDFRADHNWHLNEWRSEAGRENMRQARLRQLAARQ